MGTTTTTKVVTVSTVATMDMSLLMDIRVVTVVATAMEVGTVATAMGVDTVAMAMEVGATATSRAVITSQ